MFHYTVTVNKTVDEAVASLAESLQKRQFGVLWQLDVPAKLQEKGVTDFQGPFRILEVCNPREAAQVLSTNLNVGYFLPCKIVVFEEQGTTKIGMPKPSFLMNVLGDERLQETAVRVEKVLQEAIDEVAAS